MIFHFEFSFGFPDDLSIFLMMRLWSPHRSAAPHLLSFNERVWNILKHTHTPAAQTFGYMVRNGVIKPNHISITCKCICVYATSTYILASNFIIFGIFARLVYTILYKVVVNRKVGWLIIYSRTKPPHHGIKRLDAHHYDRIQVIYICAHTAISMCEHAPQVKKYPRYMSSYLYKLYIEI